MEKEDKVYYLPPPTQEIEGDFGPYPVRELQAARADLIKLVHENNGAIFRRVKQKCGILQDGRRRVAQSDIDCVPVDLDGAVFSDHPNGGLKRPTEDSESPQCSKKQATNKKCVAYFCDLCSFQTEDFNNVEKHLEEAVHFSASMCECLQENGAIIPKSTLKPLVATNRDARFQKLIPTCPECNAVYENINLCNLHYQTQHDNVSDVYGLSKVTETLCPEISNINQCLVCSKTFPKPKSLHDHWKSSGHIPARDALSDEIRIMFCPYCERLFYEFFSCKEHVRHVHASQIGTKSFTVRVIYLEKPKEKLHLLPASSPSTTRQLVTKEINNLQQLRKSTNKTANGKSTAKTIRGDIKLLKHYRQHLPLN